MPDDSHYDLEVLGTCMTNPTKGSQFGATVECRYLWSFAQEEALVALSEKGDDGCYRLIADPERRAKRIAARYADMYFQSAIKSGGKLQFYWVAAAAFAVKDIAESLRYAREEILGITQGAAKGLASLAVTRGDDTPYDHTERIYAALAKGNMWLFMEIYPWLWFFLEYGFDRDGTLKSERLKHCVTERDWNTLQQQSKKAVEELPFGPNWFTRLEARLAADPVYARGKVYANMDLPTTTESGKGAQMAAAEAAHEYVRDNVKSYDAGYRFPPSGYWHVFPEAYFVMESERKELLRLAGDSAATARLVKVRNFKVTGQIQNAYDACIQGASSVDPKVKKECQQKELIAILDQEQTNVLQPLIYEDPKFKVTIDLNHQASRMTGGWLTPQIKVIWSAGNEVSDPTLETIFDEPTGLWDRATGASQSLTNLHDRMIFAGKVATDFNRLMRKDLEYMEGELRKIRAWFKA